MTNYELEKMNFVKVQILGAARACTQEIASLEDDHFKELIFGRILAQ